MKRLLVVIAGLLLTGCATTHQRTFTVTPVYDVHEEDKESSVPDQEGLAVVGHRIVNETSTQGAPYYWGLSGQDTENTKWFKSDAPRTFVMNDKPTEPEDLAQVVLTTDPVVGWQGMVTETTLDNIRQGSVVTCEVQVERDGHTEWGAIEGVMLSSNDPALFLAHALGDAVVAVRLPYDKISFCYTPVGDPNVK